MNDASPYDLAGQAAEKLAELSGVERHDVALVLGSGWLPAAEMLGETVAEIATTDLPGFSAAAVAGHSGKIRSVRVGDLRALVFLSRTHYYEGKGVAAVVHGVRTAAKAGCRTIVLTNGCGGLKETWTPGTPVLISDHINLTGRSPIVGATFVDLTDLYSSRLRALCREVDPSLDEGVYVQFPGPHYETPAEVRMAGVLGGQLVGMSTTLEAIAAREAGMEVLGISLVTNLAAGISGEPLNHEEVLEAGKAAAARMGSLLSQVVPKLTTHRSSTPPLRSSDEQLGDGEQPGWSATASPAGGLEVQDVEVPEPGAGQVRVAVSAASLNFGDIARCRGGVAAVMAQPPFTLGMDVCGMVDAAGPGAEEWVGRRVVGITPQSLGGLAEQALAGLVVGGAARARTTSRPRRSRCPSTSRTSRCTSGPASRRARPCWCAAAPARSVRRRSSSRSRPAPG